MPKTDIDSQAKPYVEEFERICPKKFFTKIVRFEKLKDDSLGYCNVWHFNPWKYEIVINKDYWDISSDYDRKLLMFHELTHALGYEHSNSKDHYMYPYLNTVKPELFEIQLKEIVEKYCYER